MSDQIDYYLFSENYLWIEDLNKSFIERSLGVKMVEPSENFTLDCLNIKRATGKLKRGVKTCCIENPDLYKVVEKWLIENDIPTCRKKILPCSNIGSGISSSLMNDPATVLNEIGSIEVWKDIVSSGHAAIRIIDKANDHIWDIFSMKETVFEVDKKTQVFLQSKLDSNVLRNVMSYLSPCASESCYIWCNRNDRIDTATEGGHVFNKAEMISILTSERMVAIENRLSIQSKCLKDCILQACLDDRIDFEIPKCAQNIRIRSCFGLMEVLQEATLRFHMKNPDIKVLRFLSTHTSPASRGSLNTQMKRGKINLLTYVAYLYKKENNIRCWDGIQKYPKHDKKIFEILDDDKKKTIIKSCNAETEPKFAKGVLSGFSEYDIGMALSRFNPSYPVDFDKMADEVRDMADLRRVPVVVNSGNIINELLRKKVWMSREVKVMVKVKLPKDKEKKRKVRGSDYLKIRNSEIYLVHGEPKGKGKKNKNAAAKKKPESRILPSNLELIYKKIGQKQVRRQAYNPKMKRKRVFSMALPKRGPVVGYYEDLGEEETLVPVDAHTYLDKESRRNMNIQLHNYRKNLFSLEKKLRALPQQQREWAEESFVKQRGLRLMNRLRENPLFNKVVKKLKDHERSEELRVIREKKLNQVEKIQREKMKKLMFEILERTTNYVLKENLFGDSDY